DNPPGVNALGVTYVVFGRSAPANFPNPYVLTSLNGNDGFRLLGDPNTSTEDTIAGAGDINNDGFSDVLIGDDFTNATTGIQRAGRTYVVYGGDSIPATQMLTNLNGSNGFIINGATSFSGAGIGVGGVGDVNADGVDDFGVAAGGFSVGGGTGRTYILYGTSAPDAFPAVFSLGAIDGTTGFTLDNASPFTDLANLVAAAGDVNNDGLDDLITGARFKRQPPAISTGGAYIVYGRPAPEADLALAFRSCGTPAPTGGSFLYGITVRNVGPDTAQAFSVDIALDSDLSLNDSFPAGVCTEVMGEVVCDGGDLLTDQVMQFAIQVTSDVNTVSPVVSSAQVSSSTSDPNGANNLAMRSDIVLDAIVFSDSAEKCRPD
ncbi:MAG: hypothetical protein AAGH65_06150, partial [Pseudomonadota bacterium]